MGDSFFGNARAVRLILAVIFIAALGIRLFDLTDLPKDFNISRQMYSFVKARGMYYEMATNVPEWKRAIAIQQLHGQAPLEPPVFEKLVSLSYLVFGEKMWIARIYSALFWLLGGVGLFLLAHRLTSTDGALVALLYYLFLYFAIVASRSFQPEPLMIALTFWALWAFDHWLESESWKWAVATGLFTGFAIYVKPPIMGIHLFGAYAFALLSTHTLRDLIKSKQVWAMAGLAALPVLLYILFGLYLQGELGSQAALRFFPELWTQGRLYVRWVNLIGNTAGFGAFVLALFAIFVADPKRFRPLLIGLWLGYLVYGFTLPHHISTHNYYQLPAIAIIALSLAAIGDVLFATIKELYSQSLFARIAVLVLIAAVAGKQMWDVRVFLLQNNYRPEVKFWEMLGDKLGHTTEPILGLTEDNNLDYWGFQPIDHWFLKSDINLRQLADPNFDVLGTFKERVVGRKYFIVTMFSQLDNQPDVKDYVYKTYPIYEQGEGYIIFDLQHPLVQQ